MRQSNKKILRMLKAEKKAEALAEVFLDFKLSRAVIVC